MRYSTQIKPISYVKAHAAELLDRITEEREPIIITQNGEARAVLVDIHSYEETQETLSLLHILAIGEKQIEAGQTYSIEEVIGKIRGRRSSRNGQSGNGAGNGESLDAASAEFSVAQ
jgi:prevent-host-death family protein